MEFVARLFSSDFLPHGHCFFWDPVILWLNVASDIAISLAYFSIPLALLTYVKRRKDLRFHWIFLLFAAFIFACGITHLVEIWTMWNGSYYLQGSLKLVTALVSVTTAVFLWRLIPQALEIPSRSDLETALQRLQVEQEKSKETSEVLDAIIENVPNIVSLKDAETLQIVQMNRAGLEALGMSISEITGKSAHDIFPKDQADRMRDQDREVLLSGKPLEIPEETIVLPLKGERIFKTRKVALKDRHGHSAYVLGISEDITQPKQSAAQQTQSYAKLEKLVAERTADLDAVNSRLRDQISELQTAEQRFRLALESAPSAMVMIDEHGTIALINEETERLFGYSRDELVGQTVECLVPLQYRESHPSLRSSYMGCPVKRSMGEGRDLYAVHKNGSQFPVEIGLNPISIGAKRYILSSIIDNTERARIWDELTSRNEEMQQLLYTVSHDLKSPLVTIHGFSGLLKEQLAAGNLSDAEDSARRVGRAIDTMSSLIDDLLELSRIARHEVHLESVTVGSVIEGVKESLAAQIQESGANIEVEVELPVVISDARRLYQVFQNLISNAVKYGTDGKPPRIFIGAKEHPTRWDFYVRDEGPGIRREYHKKIFQLFHRLRNDSDGTGIGLAIVAKVSRMLGGKAWVESDTGKGSTFWFSIAKSTLPTSQNVAHPLNFVGGTYGPSRTHTTD